MLTQRLAPSLMLTIKASSSTSYGYGTNDYPTYEPTQNYQYSPVAVPYDQEEHYDERTKVSKYWDPVKESAKGG
jgi:hypothetical protein